MTIVISPNDVHAYLRKHPLAPVALDVISIKPSGIILKATGEIPFVPVRLSCEATLKDLHASPQDGVTGTFHLDLPLMLRPFRTMIENYVHSRISFLDFKQGVFAMALPAEVWDHVSAVSIGLGVDQIILTATF